MGAYLGVSDLGDVIIHVRTGSVVGKLDQRYARVVKPRKTNMRAIWRPVVGHPRAEDVL